MNISFSRNWSKISRSNDDISYQNKCMSKICGSSQLSYSPDVKCLLRLQVVRWWDLHQDYCGTCLSQVEILLDSSFKNAEATSTLPLGQSEFAVERWVRCNSSHMTGYRAYGRASHVWLTSIYRWIWCPYFTFSLHDSHASNVIQMELRFEFLASFTSKWARVTILL